MKRFLRGTTAYALLAGIIVFGSPVFAAQPKANEIPARNAAAPSEENTLAGKVVETMNAGGYTYVRVERHGEKTWAVIPQMKVNVGQKIALKRGVEFKNFTSKSLNRTFASIFFSDGPLASSAAGNVSTAANPTLANAGDGEGKPLAGKVVETMNAGGYTYVCLEKNGKKTWVAVPQMQVAVGQEIAFPPGSESKNFKSKTLNRTFETIYFTGAPLAPTGAAGASNAQIANHEGSKAAITTPGEKISVEKAIGPNAYTVGEIYAKKTLNDKEIVVRGKVVKVSTEQIMGKIWIHLQDGTGNPKKNENDLVVTTQDSPAAGDIVIAKGRIHRDKDFGYGYKYEVIMEEATIQH